jgi:hypothetical protein
MYGVKMSEEAHVWLPAVCWMVKQVYIDHNPCAVFKKKLTLWCPPLFSCCLFLVDTAEAIICHWWYIESKWVKKPMYGYQQCVKWSSWSILLIIRVLNSQRGGCCNAHHCFAVAHSYLPQRPWFVTSEELNQSDWRSTYMGTSSALSNCVAGLYQS